MTTGNLLYLLMCLAMFGLFSVVLAWVSRQQSETGSDTLVDAADEPEPKRSLAA